MLTKIKFRNFKRFGSVEVDLGNPVVFIGPNNSGKTSALQALALWQVGLSRWNERRKGKDFRRNVPESQSTAETLLRFRFPTQNSFGVIFMSAM